MADAAERLLLAALSCPPGDPGPAPREPGEWERLLALAAAAGVSPQIYLYLQGREGVPSAVSGRLAALYHANAARSRRLRTLAVEVSGQLAQAGIPCCLLKGTALHETMRGADWSRRFSADLDLLLGEGDLERAWELLRGLGGQAELPADGGHHHLPALFLEGFPVELHHTICRPSLGVRLDVEQMRKRARAPAGSPLAVLAPGDQLLHLCLHLAGSHGFTQGLRGLHDLGLLVWRLGSELDWEGLLTASREMGSTPYLYHALAPAARLLGAPVPPEVLFDLGRRLPAGPATSRLAQAAIRQQLLPWRWPRRHLPPHFSAHLCYCLVAPMSGPARLGGLLKMALVPLDWSRPEPWPLPAPRHLPYPVWIGIRPALLTVRYLWRMLGLSPPPRRLLNPRLCARPRQLRRPGVH